MEDLTGRQFGPYQIIAPLGEGGMAAVYKAYQPAMERYVALKVLPRHLAADPEFVTRFGREAKLLAQLQHPHILPVFDSGQAEGYTYIVMPFVESGTLTQSLNGQPMPLPRLGQIITQIGEALHYAHTRGLIHRDVKPSNVLMDESGNCLLTDFGLARMMETSDNLTATGAMMGTPAYMAPEQGAGQGADARSDIYSLGVILYELATGRVPYKAETPIAVVFKHIQDPLPPARNLNPELPEAVERVILKALAKQPEDRYQTAGEMVRALQAALSELPTLPMREVERPSTPTVAAQPERPRPRWVWGLAGLVAVVIIIGGLFAAFGRGAPANLTGVPTPPQTGQAIGTPAHQSSLPTPASFLSSSEPLPPEVAGNIRSAKASFGCGVLLGLASNNDEQLSVCGLMPSLPEEWITKVKRVNVDCDTLAGDYIVVTVWTEANYTGDTWYRVFECPTSVPGSTATTEALTKTCFGDVADVNRVEVPIEASRLTERRFGVGQPQAAVLAIHFTSAGHVIGEMQLQSLASGLGYDILNVVDGACQPLTTYENITRPDQPKDAPYAFDTLRYNFSEMVIEMEIFYTEHGGGQLELRAQSTWP